MIRGLRDSHQAGHLVRGAAVAINYSSTVTMIV